MVACWALCVSPGATPVMLVMLPTVIWVAVTPTSVAPPLLEALHDAEVRLAPPPPAAVAGPPPPPPLPVAPAAVAAPGPPVAPDPAAPEAPLAANVPPPTAAPAVPVAVPVPLPRPSARARAPPVSREPHAVVRRAVSASTPATFRRARHGAAGRGRPVWLTAEGAGTAAGALTGGLRAGRLRQRPAGRVCWRRAPRRAGRPRPRDARPRQRRRHRWRWRTAPGRPARGSVPRVPRGDGCPR